MDGLHALDMDGLFPWEKANPKWMIHDDSNGGLGILGNLLPVGDSCEP